MVTQPAADERVDALFARTREELLAAAGATPLSTYRLQFNHRFTFEDGRKVAGYLARLGISHLYSSPILRAGAGSMHGYDVIDHTTHNPELGTEEDHAALCAELRRQGLGLVLDVVPNHMGIEAENPAWLDVLENGPASVFATFFDVDWEPVKDELWGKVLLPVLGDQYGVVLEKGELKLEYRDGAFHVRYWDRRFPVAMRQYATILRLHLDALLASLGPDTDEAIELLSILTAIEHLPLRTETERLRQVERNREKQVIKRRLREVVARCPAIGEHLARNLEALNGRPGDPRSFDGLDGILEASSYRLAHWRVAGEEINYRRFFDINSLAAVRVEDPAVFEHTHRLVFRWVREGKVQGLRIDHPDGLFDPTAYFQDLQERYLVERARARFEAQGGAAADWPATEAGLRRRFRAELEAPLDSPLRKALYVIIEKIQGGRERIPDAWAVHGTVGYRFANAITGLLVDRSAEQALTDAYERFIGRRFDYTQLLYEKKRLILSSAMSSEVNVLAHELNRISELDRRTRDFTLNSLRRALVEFIAHFPVYRTYVDMRGEVDERDIHYIDWTIHRAKRWDPTTNPTIFDFLRDVLMRRYRDHLGEDARALMLRFAMKVQQLTGPVMAKGLEDTTFYIYNRLTSLNEVGGEPERFGTSLDVFHLRNQERAEYWPASLLASSTHDTKRSEDVRARIDVISELPSEWAERVQRWAFYNAGHKVEVKEAQAPDPNDEYLYYQALLGAWPMGPAVSAGDWQGFRDRIAQYMQKAIKEAKVHTSWTNPDPDYDAAMARFVERTTDRQLGQAFLADVEAFKLRVERPGQLNALAQVVLKAASPGVCDVYQGQELWDLSLVDPDNRRPVDYARRDAALRSLDERAAQDRGALCAQLWRRLSEGEIKLYTTAEALRLRQRHPAMFRRGGYVPLETSGPHAHRVVALLRRHEDEVVIAVVPRLTVGLLDAAGELAPALRGTLLHVPAASGVRRLVNVYTGEALELERGQGGLTLDAGRVLAAFPVALLERSA